MIAHGATPCLFVHDGKERLGWSLSTHDGLTDLEEDVRRVVDGLW